MKGEVRGVMKGEVRGGERGDDVDVPSRPPGDGRMY